MKAILHCGPPSRSGKSLGSSSSGVSHPSTINAAATVSELQMATEVKSNLNSSTPASRFDANAILGGVKSTIKQQFGAVEEKSQPDPEIAVESVQPSRFNNRLKSRAAPESARVSEDPTYVLCNAEPVYDSPFNKSLKKVMRDAKESIDWDDRRVCAYGFPQHAFEAAYACDDEIEFVDTPEGVEISSRIMKIGLCKGNGIDRVAASYLANVEEAYDVALAQRKNRKKPTMTKKKAVMPQAVAEPTALNPSLRLMSMNGGIHHFSHGYVFIPGVGSRRVSGSGDTGTGLPVGTSLISIPSEDYWMFQNFNNSFAPGGLYKATAVMTCKGLQSATWNNVTLAMGLYTNTADQPTSALPQLSAAAVSSTFMAEPDALADSKYNTHNGKIVCSLVFDPAACPAAPGFPDAYAYRVPWALRLGMVTNTGLEAPQFVSAPWPFDNAWNDVLGSLVVTIDYIPPKTPLALSGDVESNPGPMVAMVLDGKIVDAIRVDGKVQNSILAAMHKCVPVELTEALLKPEPSGPDVVEWQPEDAHTHKSAVERKVVPTNSFKPAVGEKSNGKVRKETDLAHDVLDCRADDKMKGGWCEEESTSRPIGVTDKTASSRVESVIKRVCSKISTDGDYIKWLVTRRPRISWAYTIGSSCNLGGVGLVAMDLYRCQMNPAMWSLVYSARAKQFPAFVASLAFTQCKMGMDFPNQMVAANGVLTNLELLSDPPPGVKMWKHTIRQFWNSFCEQVTCSDEAIQLPSMLALMCVEPNPGPVADFVFLIAMMALIGIEPNPGPGEEKKAKWTIPSCDITGLVKLPPSDSQRAFDALDVIDKYVSFESPNNGADTLFADAVMTRVITADSTVLFTTTTPPEFTCLYRTGVGDPSAESPTFYAVRPITNKTGVGKYTACTGTDEFIKLATGPMATRADRAVRAGFRFADILSWVATITSQSKGVLSVSAAHLPNSSFYLNFLKVCLALAPKLMASPRFPAGFSIGGLGAVNLNAEQYTLSYNNGPAAEYETIADFAYTPMAETAAAPNLSFWVSAIQAQTSTDAVLAIPDALIAAAGSEDQANKFVALLVRMWSVHPNEFAFLNLSGGSKHMANSSMVVVPGAVGNIRLICPISQSAPLPEDAGDAASQTLFVPKYPGQPPFTFSVGAPAVVSLPKYCGRWIASTTAQDILAFLDIMGSLLKCRADIDAALHDAILMSNNYWAAYTRSEPANIVVIDYHKYSTPSGVTQSSVPDGKDRYPFDANAIAPIYYGRQTDISVFNLIVTGMIEDQKEYPVQLKNFNTVSDLSRGFRYPARALAVTMQACWHLMDVSSSIWRNSKSSSYLGQYAVLLRNVTCDGNGDSPKWPIFERAYRMMWGFSPPSDSTGMNICGRLAYNAELDLAAPVRGEVDDPLIATQLCPTMIPDILMFPAGALCEIFEPLKPSPDLERARFHKDADAVSNQQALWLSAAAPAAARMVAPIRPDSSLALLLADEFAKSSTYERDINRFLAALTGTAGSGETAGSIASTVGPNLLATYVLDAKAYKAVRYRNQPLLNSNTGAFNEITGRCSYTVPRVTITDSGVLQRVFWSFLSFYTQAASLSGEQPYAIDTFSSTRDSIGDRVALKSGGVNVSELSMDTKTETETPTKADMAAAVKTALSNITSAPAANV